MKFLFKTLRFFSSLILIPLVFLVTTFFLNQKGFFNVSDIDIRVEDPIGQYNFLKPEIEKMKISLEKYQGQSLWKVELSEVAESLKNDLWIEGSRVSKAWPSTIAITVKPFEIKMLYMNKSGHLQPVIRDGDLLSSIESSMAPDVVLLQGDLFEKSQTLRKKAVEVLRELPAEGSFSAPVISEISYDSKDGFWMKMIKSDIRVKLGEDKIGLKSKRVSQVIDYLEKHEMSAQVIDANLSKKVLVRIRKN